MRATNLFQTYLPKPLNRTVRIMKKQSSASNIKLEHGWKTSIYSHTSISRWKSYKDNISTEKYQTKNPAWQTIGLLKSFETRLASVMGKLCFMWNLSPYSLQQYTKMLEESLLSSQALRNKGKNIYILSLKRNSLMVKEIVKDRRKNSWPISSTHISFFTCCLYLLVQVSVHRMPKPWCQLWRSLP